jgi:hypothetical protein
LRADLEYPPLTEAKPPLALFWCTPLTEAWLPLAVLPSPPLTEDETP